MKNFSAKIISMQIITKSINEKLRNYITFCTQKHNPKTTPKRTHPQLQILAQFNSPTETNHNRKKRKQTKADNTRNFDNTKADVAELDELTPTTMHSPKPNNTQLHSTHTLARTCTRTPEPARTFMPPGCARIHTRTYAYPTVAIINKRKKTANIKFAVQQRKNFAANRKKLHLNTNQTAKSQTKQAARARMHACRMYTTPSMTMHAHTLNATAYIANHNPHTIRRHKKLTPELPNSANHYLP